MQVTNHHAHQVEFEKAEIDFDSELDVIEDDEESTEDVKDKGSRRVRRAVRKIQKQRRPSDQESIKNVNDKFDPQKEIRKRSDIKNAKELDKIQNKIEKEFKTGLKDYINTQKANAEKTTQSDKVSLSQTFNSDIADKNVKEAIKNKKKETDNQLKLTNPILTPKVEEKVRSYISAITTASIKKAPEKKAKLEQIRQSLREDGVSTKQLRAIEKNTSAMIQSDLKKQLKKQYLRIALSFNDKLSGGLFKNYSDYYSLLEVAKQANVFNANNKDIKQFQNQLKEEINFSLTSELDRELVATKLETSSIDQLIKTFEKYNSIANMTKFNINEYVTQLNKKMEDYGLKEFTKPEKEGPIDCDTDDNSKNQQNQKQDQEREDIQTEKELMETDLRNAYIKSFFKSSFLNSVKTKLAIEKQKKDIKNNNVDINITAIQKEAKKIAGLRLFLNLRTLLETRASLPSLETNAYRQVKSKIKETLKNLKQIDRFVSAKELKELKHQCNRTMFSIIKEEYIKQKVFAQSRPDDKIIENKVSQLEAILIRLKTETKIIEKTNPKLMEDLHFLNDVNIVEAA